MAYISGNAIDDIEILRDDAGTAITGAVEGDFTTFEAYLLPSGATTATLTLTEIGNGEYAFTFTPSAAGTWVRHAIYDSGGTTAEFIATYVVSGSAAEAGVFVGDPYLSVADFRLRVGSAASATDDQLLAVLNAATQQVDRYCDQSFAMTSSLTKYFSPDDPSYVCIPPLVSVSALATDQNQERTYGIAWETTDYDLTPYDAADRYLPYTTIERTPRSILAFPCWSRGLRVTGVWGWPVVPPPIVEATFYIANRAKSLWTAPFGQTGAGELGAGLDMTAAMTPIIREMLAPFRAIVLR